ncbi:MAG: LysM peptidoglycan-binding domain-containing protein [Bacilli bacterium]|nr:LysM peptidoglycan-binding domain-containing protein [Bacilli bacterium]
MYKVYQIEYGDTLDIISDKSGATIDELLQLNGEFDVIPGKYIVIPNMKDEMFEMYKVKSGDNVYSIAKEYNIDLDDLLALNGLNKNDYIYPNQEIMVPSSSYKIYITKNGDTIRMVLNNLNLPFDVFNEQNEKILLIPDQLIVYKKND